MPNIAEVLKTEIARISRKEIRNATKKLHTQNITLKQTVADLKGRVSNLEKDKKRLTALEKKHLEQQSQITEEDSKKVRLTTKGMRSLRKKLGLSQIEFGKLLGTSNQSVYNWESKEGALKLRESTKLAILSVRNIGAREAKRRLDEINTKNRLVFIKT